MYGSALQYKHVQQSLNVFQQLLKLLLFKSALFSANVMIKCIKSFLTTPRKQVLKSCFLLEVALLAPSLLLGISQLI